MPKKRSGTVRQVKSVMHIYCEGEKTEPNYLRQYIQTKFPGQPGRRVIEIEATKKNTPVQLVNLAVAEKESDKFPDGDEFWVVYDRESPTKYPDTLHANARKNARDHGVSIALSNVCFELWILLHFKDNTAPYGSCADLLDNSGLKKLLKNCGIGDYEKGNARIFDKIKGEIDVARDRAKVMNRNTHNNAPPTIDQPHQLNPYTDMHLLLDAIDAFPQRFAKEQTLP